MGGICSKLFCLLCCPPYLPTIVSKVAFCPPICSYTAIRDSKSSLKFIISNFNFEIGSQYENYITYHIIKTKTEDILSCMYIKTAPWTKNTILFSHGNAVDIGIIAETLIELSLYLKVNIITYDYSGYGISSGQPSERNLYSNILSVLEYMHQNFDIPHKHIILYGQSIGSVPTIFLATKFQFGAVVLHSALASGFRFLHCCCGCLFGCCDILNNAKKVSKISCPILIIHGMDDEVTPVEHSYDLLKRIPSEFLLEPLFIEYASHNNCEIFPIYKHRLQHLIEYELELFQTNITDSIYLSK